MIRFVFRNLFGLGIVAFGTLILCFTALASALAEFRNLDLVAAWKVGSGSFLMSLGFYAATVWGFWLAYVGVGLMERGND